MCSRWVLKFLTKNHRKKRSVGSLDFLIYYGKEGDDIMSLTITGAETWPSHPHWIQTTKDGMVTHNLSHQGQSQTNAAKANDYSNCTLGQGWCFAGRLNDMRNDNQLRCAHSTTLTKLERAIQIQNKSHALRRNFAPLQSQASHF